MISLNLVELVAYLLPGYIISAPRHFFYVGKQEKETNRAIESLVVSIVFFALLNKIFILLDRIDTFNAFVNLIQQGSIFSDDFWRCLPWLIIFIGIGSVLYWGMYYLWTIFAINIFKRAPQRFVYDAFADKKTNKKIYFKLEGDESLFRGMLCQGDLDEGTEIWLSSIQVKQQANGKRSPAYQYFADDMLINREKVVYLYTKNGDE